MMNLELAKEQIKARADLLNYCERNLEKDKRNIKNKFNCIFCNSGHGTHGTGDLTVYTDNFYCFSCNKYGDIFTLYQQLNNCDFITAVKELAKEYGVNIENYSNSTAPTKAKAPTIKTAPKIKEHKLQQASIESTENKKSLFEVKTEESKKKERRIKLLNFSKGNFIYSYFHQIIDNFTIEYFNFFTNEENLEIKNLLKQLLNKYCLEESTARMIEIAIPNDDRTCLYFNFKPYIFDTYSIEDKNDHKRLIAKLKEVVNG